MEGWRDLPEVLILDIFVRLPLVDRLNASSTCKRWREVLFHPYNWSQVRVDLSKSRLQKEAFLISRVAHFVSACTITSTDECSSVYSIASDDSSCIKNPQLMLERLLYKLSFNCRLQELSFRIHLDNGYQSCDENLAPICGDTDRSISKENNPIQETSLYRSYLSKSEALRESFKSNDK